MCVEGQVVLLAEDRVVEHAIGLQKQDGGLLLSITTVGMMFIRVDLFRPVPEGLRDAFLGVVMRNAHDFIEVYLHHQTIYYYNHAIRQSLFTFRR
jgi:hypothetical protein